MNVEFVHRPEEELGFATDLTARLQETSVFGDIPRRDSCAVGERHEVDTVAHLGRESIEG